MTTAHSRIGASSMYRWSACPGSVRESVGMPEVKSKYAEEGTLAHAYAAQLLEKWLFDKIPEERLIVDWEMDAAVRTYAEAFLDAARGADFIWIERRCNLERLHLGLFGTPDGIIYHAKTRVLQVWDYKNGAGIPVDVENNNQLMYYGLAALLETGVLCDWVELVIAQPNCDHRDGPIRKWRISSLDLLEFSADLIEAAKRTEDPNAPLASGPHCRFCPAVAKCTLLQEQALITAQSEFSPTLPYDQEQLSKVLGMLPAIEAWVKGVYEFAESEALAGKIPPGFKLVQKTGRRKWKDEEQIIPDLVLNLGLEESLLVDKKLKSPAQIEKLLSKEDKKLLENYTIKPSGGLDLVSDTDKRPPIKADVLTEFSVITE